MPAGVHQFRGEANRCEHRTDDAPIGGQDRYDKAIVVSGDTDLIPAVKAVRSTFPGKQIGVIIPIGRASEDFKKEADFHYKMREHHLVKSRYPDILTLTDGTVLNCPLNWK